jgi:hypothetical protein
VRKLQSARIAREFAEVRARVGGGGVEGLDVFAEERLAAESARSERELAEAALPTSITEMDS